MSNYKQANSITFEVISKKFIRDRM